MDINGTIITKLDYKDIALIAVALGMYQDAIKDSMNQNSIDMRRHARSLVDRLGNEMYSTRPGYPAGYVMDHERATCETCKHCYDNKGTVPSQEACLTCKKHNIVVHEGDSCFEHEE